MANSWRACCYSSVLYTCQTSLINHSFFFFLLNLKFLLNIVLQAAIINYLELARKIEGHPRTKLDLIIVWTGVEKGQAQSGTRVNVTMLVFFSLSGKVGGTQS